MQIKSQWCGNALLVSRTNRCMRKKKIARANTVEISDMAQKPCFFMIFDEFLIRNHGNDQKSIKIFN